jgi:hypothetical protein
MIKGTLSFTISALLKSAGRIHDDFHQVSGVDPLCAVACDGAPADRRISGTEEPRRARMVRAWMVETRPSQASLTDDESSTKESQSVWHLEERDGNSGNDCGHAFAGFIHGRMLLYSPFIPQ